MAAVAAAAASSGAAGAASSGAAGAASSGAAGAATDIEPVEPWRTSVHDLPNELLGAVFSHLSSPSSLVPLFREDASTIMDMYYAARGPRRRSSSPRRRPHHHPLKSASLVSRRWRAAALPHLFRHVLWTFRRLEEPPAEAYRREGGRLEDVAAWFDVLAFLRRNRLGAAVEGLTLHVPCPEHLIDDPTELVGRYGLVPSSTAVPPAASSGTTTRGEGDRGAGEDEDAESVVLSETASLVVAEVNGHATWANTWFWDLLFAVVDPLRVSFLAAPVVLATMLSRKVFTRCQPLMMTRYHLISVARPGRTSTGAPSSDGLESDDDLEDDDDDGFPELTAQQTSPPCDNLPCELFSHQRWTSLLANEGSSVSIYKSDGGYGEIPPSPLLSLLGSRDRSTRRFLRRSLRRLAYVAVMPMATHVQATLGTARLVPPRLEELFVQVMPRGVGVGVGGSGSGSGSGGATFEGLEMEDLVMERDAAYGLLFAGIFVPGPRREWEPLRVFETGDADGDEVAWAEAVETVGASSSCWEVESQGRFVRNVARETGRRRRRWSAAAQEFSTPF